MARPFLSFHPSLNKGVARPSFTAHRAGTVLWCAFCEEEDDQATRSFLLCQVLKHISNTSCSALHKIRNVYVFAD